MSIYTIYDNALGSCALTALDSRVSGLEGRTGKSLGEALTTPQSRAIRAGTFDGVCVGDYWTINDIVWRIVDIDPYYMCGYPQLTTHHVAVMPDTILYSAQWNTTDDTSGGYYGSAIRANIKASGGAEEMFVNAFSDSHVLTYQAMYPSAFADTVPTAATWREARVELPSEMEVYGAQIWRFNGFEVGIGRRQFSLFRASEIYMNAGAGWWLRTAGGADSVSRVNSLGRVDNVTASTSSGVRPFALIS